MTQQQASPRLRLDRRFFEACDRLPMSARAAVLECLTKLLENPAHPSLKYESVRRAADPRMRSIRINEQYRAIVAHPEGGSEYLLLWQLPTPRRPGTGSRHSSACPAESCGARIWSPSNSVPSMIAASRVIWRNCVSGWKLPSLGCLMAAAWCCG